MSTIDFKPGLIQGGLAPGHETYKQAPHFRTKDEEFDACKTGMWLFLATEVLLFAGIFVWYSIYRMMYPDAFRNGSSYLDWRWGGLNTVVLLISSYTMAMSINHFQHNRQKEARRNLVITLVCGAAFVAIKLLMEYIPKMTGWHFDPTLSHAHGEVLTKFGGLFYFEQGYGGKLPGVLFAYPFATDPHENMWWSLYYTGTGLHAAHVLIGMALIARVWWFSRPGVENYGPKHYTGVEMAGLYWHIVDLIWIFLFPLLYLIH
jgi:cytochrome c oxidase subunit 3